MRILWIPHSSWFLPIRQREHYLIDQMKEKHEIHVLTWSEPKGPRLKYFLDLRVHMKALQSWSKKEEIHLHNFRRLCLSRFNTVKNINEYFFQKRIREVVGRENIEAVIYSSTHYLNGFPPLDLKVPLIFDYSDHISDIEVRERYLKNSSAVLCVSKVLYEEAKEYNSNVYYLPNGVDIEKFKTANSRRIIEKYKLENSKVISLIGITCSERLYFLDAFPLIKKEVPEAKFLVVGDSYLIPEMKRRARGFEKDIIFIGWVDYKEMQDYFAASDVGIYPVEKNAYYDAACPIKILEYTAANKPVVSTDLKELHNLNFPNVIFAKPNAKDFSQKVIQALNTKFHCPDLKEYDLDVLTEKLEEILESIVKEKQ